MGDEDVSRPCGPTTTQISSAPSQHSRSGSEGFPTGFSPFGADRESIGTADCRKRAGQLPITGKRPGEDPLMPGQAILTPMANVSAAPTQ